MRLIRLSAKRPPVIDEFMSSSLSLTEKQGKPKKLLDLAHDVPRFKDRGCARSEPIATWIARCVRFDSFADR